MQHGPRTQDPDEEEDDDLDADPDADTDFHDGEPMTDFCDLCVRVADTEVRISAQDPETATDLFRIALDGVAKLRGSESN